MTGSIFSFYLFLLCKSHVQYQQNEIYSSNQIRNINQLIRTLYTESTSEVATRRFKFIRPTIENTILRMVNFVVFILGSFLVVFLI